MELVYLWVEEYKNIKEQGFNFSPRFDCKYDKDSNELTIDEKKDYISIFPENINVTAIVGENGSGKTSILNEINNYLVFRDRKILIYKDKQYHILYFPKGNEDKPIKVLSTDKLEENYSINDLNEITEKDILDKLFLYLTNSFGNIQKDDNPAFSTIIYNNKNNDTANIIHMLKNGKIAFPFWVSRKIYIDLYNNKVGQSIEDILKKLKDNKIILELMLYESDEKEERLKYMYLDLLSNRMGQGENFDFNSNPENLIIYIQKSQKTNDIDKLIESLEKIIEKKVLKSINDFLSELKNFHFKTNHELYLDVKKISVDFINNYNNAIGDEDMYNFSFNESYSTGEESFLRIFSQLYKYVEDKKLICIDEIENGFHPNWQKKLVNHLMTFLLSNFKNKKIHLILTSHSPFLISDILKENVIFLEDGKQKKPFKEKEQTFGANIHTLLSDGFFMKDGLMGEFAKGRIKEIKKFYDENKNIRSDNTNFQTIKDDYKSKIKSFRHIQSIICEPFLQTVIKNYLDELEIIFNGKKQFLQNEIKRLQELESSL